jgi:hypothetical protein
MKTVRVFVSSPGDVEAEREKAAKIFSRLQSEFSGRVAIAPYFWEHEPMLVTGIRGVSVFSNGKTVGSLEHGIGELRHRPVSRWPLVFGRGSERFLVA